MKRFVALVLQVVAILAFTGSSLGDGDGGAEILPPTCPVILDEGERMNMKLIGLGVECLDTTGNDDRLLFSYTTLEEHKYFFYHYCKKFPQIRECLRVVVRKSQSCQNETRHQLFQVFRELLETILDEGCVQDHEVFANIVMIYNHNTTIASNTNVFFECVATYVEKIGLSLRMPVSDFSTNNMLFMDILLAKKCLNYIKEGDQHIKYDIVYLLNGIVEKYKCFNPQDDSVILCEDLHFNHHLVNIIDGKRMVCPIKSADENTKPLYTTLVNSLLVCLQVSLRDEIQTIDDLADLEKSRLFFKHQCDKKPTVISCFTAMTFLSAPCLDDSHQLMMETVKDLLQNALEHACADGGRYLARVVTKIVRDVANSTKPNYLKECKNEAFPSTEVVGTNFTSEKTLEYYKKIMTFKRCFINKLQGDDVAVSSAELILNGVINNMKCPNPEQTTLVPCNTLANNDLIKVD